MGGPKGPNKLGTGDVSYKVGAQEPPKIKFRQPEMKSPDIKEEARALHKKVHGGQKAGVLKSPKLPPIKELRTEGQAYKVLVLPQGNQPLTMQAIKEGWSYAGSSQGRIFYSQPEHRSKVLQAIESGSCTIVGVDEETR